MYGATSKRDTYRAMTFSAGKILTKMMKQASVIEFRGRQFGIYNDWYIYQPCYKRVPDGNQTEFHAQSSHQSSTMCCASVFLVPALVLLLSGAYAQVTCNGKLSAPSVVTSDVIVDGGSCTLIDVNVTGSVSVTNGGSLTTFGFVTVFGGIEAMGSGPITLYGTLMVKGEVRMEGTNALLTLGGKATVGGVSIADGVKAKIFGTTGSVSAKEAGLIFLYGGTVTGGGVLVELGNGNLLMCGANVTGGVKVIETVGNVVIAPGKDCPPSAIVGSINVEKGNGLIQLSGGHLDAADLNVVENIGPIKVSDTTLSDVKIEKTTGNVMLKNITSDSDGTLVEINGAVTMLDSMVSGDFGLKGGKAATFARNNFGGESFSISEITGPVMVMGNKEFSVSIIENQGLVAFNDNNSSVVELNKNTGSVSVSDNTFMTISCIDNSPVPTGSGNIVTVVANGQCASL